MPKATTRSDQLNGDASEIIHASGTRPQAAPPTAVRGIGKVEIIEELAQYPLCRGVTPLAKGLHARVRPHIRGGFERIVGWESPIRCADCGLNSVESKRVSHYVDARYLSKVCESSLAQTIDHSYATHTTLYKGAHDVGAYEAGAPVTTTFAPDSDTLCLFKPLSFTRSPDPYLLF